jgi:integrase
VSGSEYEPRLDGATWSAIGPFVAAAVTACVSTTPYEANALQNVASRLTAWTWESAGLPLERSVVFNRDVIARFISIGCPGIKPAVRGNMRSQLLRMSESLLDPAAVPRRLNPLPPSDPTAPYSAIEVISLRSWAEAQSTAPRRANAQVLLALGAGCGLSAIEIGEVRVQDISSDERGVLVRVDGGRPRSVPALREWEKALIERRAMLEPDRYVFRENHTTFYPNLVTNFVNRSRVIGVRPQTQRLRSTWIVQHLKAATPVTLLMRAAGVESLEAFTRYTRFVPETDADLGRRLLRDPRAVARDIDKENDDG